MVYGPHKAVSDRVLWIDSFIQGILAKQFIQGVVAKQFIQGVLALQLRSGRFAKGTRTEPSQLQESLNIYIYLFKQLMLDIFMHLIFCFVL